MKVPDFEHSMELLINIFEKEAKAVSSSERN